MCDKRYKCKKNYNYTISTGIETGRLSNDSSSHNISKEKRIMKNRIELYSDQEELDNETCVIQPRTDNFSHSHSCCPNPREKVTFNNQSSAFASQPSFNLQTFQKSTPKRPSILTHTTTNNDLLNTQICPPSSTDVNPRTVVKIETNTNSNSLNEIRNAGTIV